MPTLMFAASQPIALRDIQASVSSEYESSIHEKLGGIMTILSVYKDGAMVVDFNATDDEDNAETMKDFRGVTDPPSFSASLEAGTLHFLLVNCNDKFLPEANQILQGCAAEGIIEFETTRKESVRQLDGSSQLL